MQSSKFETEEEWLDARRGRVTGTRLKDLVSKGGRKIGFWEIIAERIAIPATDENVMDRGKRLEEEAVERFTKETGKKVDTSLVIWNREDDSNIAISPDGFIETGKGKKKKITEAVEAKCLSSARHLEAYITKKIPSDYQGQMFQYFIVNEDLQTLYFVFYDPRMPKDFFYHTITRAEVQAEVDMHLDIEREALAEIAKIEEQLTF